MRGHAGGNGNEFNVAIIGDSQSSVFGSVTSVYSTYISIIAKARGYANFVNAAVAGETSATMVSRFSNDVLRHRPGAIGIMAGTNDIGSNVSGSPGSATWVGGGVTPTTLKANLKSMVQAGQAARARVTLLSWLPSRYEPYLTHAPDYLAVLPQIVSETGCEFVDVYTPLIAMTNDQLNALYQTSDLVHPNAAGHAYIASLCTPPAFSQF